METTAKLLHAARAIQAEADALGMGREQGEVKAAAAPRRFCYGKTHVWLKTNGVIAPEERCTCGQRVWGKGPEGEDTLDALA